MIKPFTDVRSGGSMDRPGLEALLAYAREGDMPTVARLGAARSPTCSRPWPC